MKILGWLLGLLMLITGIDDIATINRLKKQAEDAYQSGDYAQAVQYYQVLVDSMQVQDERVRLNLAHAQLHAGDTTTAQQQYSRLMNAESASIKSVAYQQLGNITTQQQQYDNALAMYKESLKANPTNEDARYNYELVKKLKKEQE
ncbi:MAG: tetratricopeptide repeat protein, partial [Bacteroidota bacterium]